MNKNKMVSLRVAQVVIPLKNTLRLVVRFFGILRTRGLIPGVSFITGFVCIGLLLWCGMFSFASDNSDQFVQIKNLIAQGKLSEAERACRELIIKDEEAFLAYNFLGNIYLQKGRSQREAVLYYQRSLEIYPHQVALYRLIAAIYTNEGENDKAMYYLKQGLALFPQDFILNLNMGIMYLFVLQDAPTAVTYLLNAQKVDPGSDKALYFLGIAYLSQGDRFRALENVTRLRKINSEKYAGKLEDIIRHYDPRQGIDMQEAASLPISVPESRIVGQDEKVSHQEAEREAAESNIEIDPRPGTTKIRGSGTLTIKRHIQRKSSE